MSYERPVEEVLRNFDEYAHHLYVKPERERLARVIANGMFPAGPSELAQRVLDAGYVRKES